MIDVLTTESAGDVVRAFHPITSKRVKMELVSRGQVGDKTYRVDDGTFRKEAWVVRLARRGAKKGNAFVKTFYRQVDCEER